MLKLFSKDRKVVNIGLCSFPVLMLSAGLSILTFFSSLFLLPTPSVELVALYPPRCQTFGA